MVLLKKAKHNILFLMIKGRAIDHFDTEDILSPLSTVQLSGQRHDNKAVRYFMI